MPFPLNRVSQPISQLYGYPVTSRLRAAVVKQGQLATLEFPLYDPNSLLPVDITDYTYLTGVGPQGPQSGVSPVSWLKFRFLEASGTTGYAYDATNQTIDNATTGIVSCIVPPEIAGNSGVYNCEVGFFDEDNNMTFSNTCYLFVERGLFTTSQTSSPSTSGFVGPPTLAEIHINLRDQPEINRLIDEYEFDVAEICEAVVRSVMYFNTAQPPISPFYTTITFPWRYQLMDGIVAHLYEMAAGYYRRNHLKHQTAGLALDDLNREMEYMRAWQERNERWTMWVKAKKAQLNMEEGFGEFGSPYAHGGHYNGGYYW